MIPVFDNHVHLQVKGENVLAAKRYERAGGNIINICNIPAEFFPSIEYFRQRYDEIVHISEKIRNETHLHVLVTVGPYPVEAIGSIKSLGKDRTMDLWLEATELAGKYIESGKAHAIGEIGRPHFPVDVETWEFFNLLLKKQFEIARDHGASIVLHTESATESTFMELAQIAERAGIERWKVVKHYSPPFVLQEENHGIFPSVMASRDNVRIALKKGYDFFMETDFLDDPQRKGAVMDIETIPKRYKMLKQEFPEKFEKYAETLAKNITRIYGYEISD